MYIGYKINFFCVRENQSSWLEYAMNTETRAVNRKEITIPRTYRRVVSSWWCKRRRKLRIRWRRRPAARRLPEKNQFDSKEREQKRHLREEYFLIEILIILIQLYSYANQPGSVAAVARRRCGAPYRKFMNLKQDASSESFLVFTPSALFGRF